MSEHITKDKTLELQNLAAGSIGFLAHLQYQTEALPKFTGLTDIDSSFINNFKCALSHYSRMCDYISSAAEDDDTALINAFSQFVLLGEHLTTGITDYYANLFQWFCCYYQTFLTCIEHDASPFINNKQALHEVVVKALNICGTIVYELRNQSSALFQINDWNNVRFNHPFTDWLQLMIEKTAKTKHEVEEVFIKNVPLSRYRQNIAEALRSAAKHGGHVCQIKAPDCTVNTVIHKEQIYMGTFKTYNEHYANLSLTSKIRQYYWYVLPGEAMKAWRVLKPA